MAQAGSVVNPSGWTRFFSELSSFIISSERQYGLANEQYTDYAIERFSLSCQSVEALIGPIRTAGAELNSICTHVTQLLWREYSDTLDLRHARSRYVPPSEASLSRRGRPSFQISREQLQYLRSLSFSWTAIANMLMVSRMTVYWRRAEYGMLDEPHFSINDEELNEKVQQILVQHPHVGQSFISGRLRSLGYRVTRERVRHAARTCDPLSAALKWHGIVTRRRPYSVPGPNSLWHIGMYTCLLSTLRIVI